MYTFSRYQAKELALAYMSSKQHVLSPGEFLQQMKKIERLFDDLLKQKSETISA
ncbi:hypothetical protein [Sodalis sp. dw_96]|uniref:hypothetical protein n=1 Tax=Sodalis sp. dw_96 TaxID=2719794 RepID=UPI001BD34C38|nr:hypothetical protein [Sodalis sp. dw_96]